MQSTNSIFSNSNFIDSFSYQEFLETLTLEQKGALVNIFLIVAIFLGVMNLIAIIASERVIEYFKLEARFP